MLVQRPDTPEIGGPLHEQVVPSAARAVLSQGTTPQDTAIATAAAAANNAGNGDFDICFCGGDGISMALLHLNCCQCTISKL